MSEGGAVEETNGPDSGRQTMLPAGANSNDTQRRLPVFVALSILCLLIIVSAGQGVSAISTESKLTPSEGNVIVADYSKFSHSSPREHEDLMGRANCGSCHRRSDGSPAPRFPLHKDCTGCHLLQFTASNSSSSINPICTICHRPDDLNSSNALPKGFPRLMSFAAEFDHPQHLKGIESARPGDGCTACHSPANRGAAETIPARLNAHQVCYTCHSPGKQASKFSACGSCHRLGPYSPTSTAARAYVMGFSHADHGQRDRLTCDSCHNLRGRGLPQAKQVSSIVAVQHLSTPRAQACMTCHNGQRAFGDKRAEFNDCKRCHKGPTFKT